MQQDYSRNEQVIHNPDPGNTYCKGSVLENDMFVEWVIQKTWFDCRQKKMRF